MTVTMYKCEGCGIAAEVPGAHNGWIQFQGPFTRSRAFWNGITYAADFLPSGGHDFCSLNCLMRALDAKREENPLPLGVTGILMGNKGSEK